MNVLYSAKHKKTKRFSLEAASNTTYSYESGPVCSQMLSPLKPFVNDINPYKVLFSKLKARSNVIFREQWVLELAPGHISIRLLLTVQVC